jgi:hypothetical protein
LAAILLTLYLLLLVNVILYRHPQRYDLTQERLHSLSSDSLVKLDLVREQIRVVFPHFVNPDDPEQVARYRVLQRARKLLNEYMTEQPLIEVVAEVNVFSEPDRWKQVASEFQLLPSQWNRLIFCAGKGNSFRQTVTSDDLADFAPSSGGFAAPPEVKAFRGEEAITGAIMRLIHRERKKVYFTQDKGELALAPKKNQPPALAAVRHDLEGSGFEAADLSLGRVDEIPEDCALLVVAGPEEQYTKSELDTIERYLLRDGRLFVSLGRRRTGLEGLLERWGVEVGAGTISMRRVSMGTRVDTYWVMLSTMSPTHPITRPFRNAPRFEVRLFSPRPLKQKGTERRLETEVLLATGGSGDEVKYMIHDGDVDRMDQKGGVAVATASWQRPVERPPPGWSQRKTRLVVVSASSFLRDPQEGAVVRGGFLSASHRNLFMNCVQWLVGEERRTSEGRERVDRTIKMSPAIRRFLFLSSVIIFPGVFFCLGLFLYFVRRA